jgi:hypothetical protein
MMPVVGVTAAAASDPMALSVLRSQLGWCVLNLVGGVSVGVGVGVGGISEPTALLFDAAYGLAPSWPVASGGRCVGLCSRREAWRLRISTATAAATLVNSCQGGSSSSGV